MNKVQLLLLSRKKKQTTSFYNACIRPSNLKKLSNKQTFIFSLQIVSVFSRVKGLKFLNYMII